MLTKTFSSSLQGINATIISIEVNITQGIRFFIVGLADNAIRESQQRIESALINNGLEWPRYRVVINLAPADIRKEGTHFDLPLAVGILAASNQVNSEFLKDYVILGELSLDGSVMPVKGVLPMTLNAKENGFKGVILPEGNAGEASVVENIEVIPVSELTSVISYLNGNQDVLPVYKDRESSFNKRNKQFRNDFSDVKGQDSVKRGLLIAASGFHNMIMIGPPGSGKTMLAKRLPSILPPMTLEESVQTTKIHSVAGKIDSKGNLITSRPFRSPHHSISNLGLIGGGTSPKPGEISLAHNGVLFLDELPEFNRHVLEVLRQPLEERTIHVSRANYSVVFPANFMFIASMNPCPCGFYNHPDKECGCGPGIIKKYLSRISGPLLDRIDIHMEVVPIPFSRLSVTVESEKSESIRRQVEAARQIQQKRFEGVDNIFSNAQMESGLMNKHCTLDKTGLAIIRLAMQHLGLSARAYDRILKVARTIADLEESDHILASHVAEAVNYRNLDREGWSG